MASEKVGIALADRKGRPGAMPGGSSTAPLVQSVSQTHCPVTSSKRCAPQREMPGHWNAALHILSEIQQQRQPVIRICTDGVSPRKVFVSHMLHMPTGSPQINGHIVPQSFQT